MGNTEVRSDLDRISGLVFNRQFYDSQVNYTNWAPGHPDNHNMNEECVLFYRKTGLWTDIPCENGLKCICELDMVCCEFWSFTFLSKLYRL